MTQENEFTQLCVWPATMLGESTPEEFESFMLEEFNARVKFAEEVVTIRGDGGPGDRHDLFFYVHSDDLGHFAIPRLQAGIRWWEDVLGNLRMRHSMIYSQEILDRYPTTWNF